MERWSLRARGTGLCALFILLVCTASLPTLAGYEEGMKAIKKKDLARAFAEFKSVAELGEARSQYQLGVMYYNGEGIPRDPALAYGWIKLAADSGLHTAVDTERQLHQFVSEQDRAAGEKQVQQYNAAAIEQRLMPKILPNCEYEDKTPPVAEFRSNLGDFYPLDAISRGIEGHVTVEILVGADGRARESRIVSAMPAGIFEQSTLSLLRKERFKPAMKDGKPVAGLFTMGFDFELSRNDSPPPPKEKGKLNNDPAYRRADKFVEGLHQQAESGDPGAQYVYAQVLAGHPRYHVLWSETLPWMTRAAAAGLKEAQFQVGESLLHGRGCKADEQKAVEWLELSAKQGYTNAQMTLAGILSRSHDSQDKTLFWLQKAADAKDVMGRKHLAAFLATTPLDSARDPKRALALADELIRADRSDPLLFEIRAASQAGVADFKAAESDESTAIKQAKRLGWDTADMAGRLAAYHEQRPWLGDLMSW